MLQESEVSSWLRKLPVCAVHELPRPERAGERTRDPGLEQRLAALVSAYHAASGGEAGEGVLAGWAREGRGAPVTVLVGGASLVGGLSEQRELVLNYPPGARGTRVAVDELLRGWSRLECWTRLEARPDVLALNREADPERLRPSLEDSLLGVWHEPFCWLLLALPADPGEVERLTGEATRKLVQAARSGQAVEAERLEARHRELRQAESLGLWNVHLLAGARNPAAVHRLAGLLAASADLTELPYVVVPRSWTGSLEEALEQRSTTFTGSTRLVAALARPPAEEVPGIRLALRPRFDVTPEAPPPGEACLELGEVLDRNGFAAGTFPLPFSSLNRHTFVCGATGAGKSQTVRGLLEQVTASGLPWLVVEPAKAEYRLMGARMPEAQVIAIRPGDPAGIPAGINPLEPEPGFPLQTHVDLVKALFLAAFEAEEPFPQVLSAALTRCYEQLGWDLTLGEPRQAGQSPRYPRLADLQRVARQVVQEVGYGPEVTQNVRGFIEVRLSSLRLGTPGRFFEGGHPIDFGRLLAHNVVLEIEDVGDDRDKAFLMGTVLVRLVEHLRALERQRPQGAPLRLRHVSVFEEAHRLLRRSESPGPAAHAVELFAGLLAEIRAYGEGLVVAEQIPGKLVPDVIKNTAIKIVHRLPALDDRQAVGATMNMGQVQSDYLVTLRPGTAAVFTDGMDFPVLVRMPDGTGRETSRERVVHAGGLVGRCSPACGRDCRQRPCTLREMREASQLLDDPRLVLWAELAVLGHLVGQPAPTPRRALMEGLRALDERRRDCAIAQAVTAAVDSRAAAAASSSVSPGDLIQHVAGALRSQLRALPACPAIELEWLAREYRWNPVWQALDSRVRQDPETPRHPDSARWEKLYRRPIPGTTCRQQREAVAAWGAASWSGPAALATLHFGVDDQSALERVVGTARTDRDWRSRLTAVLSAFSLTAPWPQAYLRAIPDGR
jgi:DNA helicase HerA-like ATPase